MKYNSRIIKNSLAVRGGIGDEEEEWFSYHFFDIKSISSRFSSTIADLRPHFTSTSEEAKKYTDDLFMVAPFYHRLVAWTTKKIRIKCTTLLPFFLQNISLSKIHNAGCGLEIQDWCWRVICFVRQVWRQWVRLWGLQHQFLTAP